MQIGETIADKSSGKPLPAIKVEEPTVKMSFSINTSPFVGREVYSLSCKPLSNSLKEMNGNGTLSNLFVQYCPECCLERFTNVEHFSTIDEHHVSVLIYHYML